MHPGLHTPIQGLIAVDRAIARPARLPQEQMAAPAGANVLILPC